MKKLTALLVLVLTMVLSILPAQAEVERSKLLDAGRGERLCAPLQ